MIASAPKLYAGEQLEQAAGFPTLYNYFPADPEKQLIVFIPGSGHNARVAYGAHRGYQQKDFLAYWLNSHGHGLLAISYPIESDPELIPATAPHFRIRDWGKQAAEVTHKIIEQHGLFKEVVLVAWSMGGRIVVPYCAHAHSLGIDVALFASLAATPGVHGSRPPPAEMSSTTAGSFALQVEEQNQKFNNGRAIFSEGVYPREYCGYTPVSLTGWGYRYDNESRKLVVDRWISTEDAAVDQFEHWPMLVALTGTSSLDARHVITDQATWSYMLTRKLMHMIEAHDVKKIAENGNWGKLIEMVHSLPSQISYSIPGNHFFFVGEPGARTTAAFIVEHLEKAKKFKQEFQALLNT
ncbi:thioesterase domain protein [Talaromyces stipitatus ATCC 10500]|uniref:Thioesterase domain protein n=1 Tax=Talaromyces stipitatus (strain ATCC 10500 / CBS 375.48 / QM 6759 / NRRL 1006) TaxID=441959 RepID=B8MAW6_TALSN|nr:thioesterase domain protein [Talaromyces stipitatus ATCC 10500]EED18667.1 thioesterase domain protein [Talaromyces stipitatus ATCC 10500]